MKKKIILIGLSDEKKIILIGLSDEKKNNFDWVVRWKKKSDHMIHVTYSGKGLQATLKCV